MRLKYLLYSTIAAGLACANANANDLVLLHSNDTHSLIDPADDGSGGVLQRKAIIDSIRQAEKNVILIDAGDIVQGTLYFKFFKGDVEYPLMDMMGYDIRVLGNHEFDNGIDDLAKYYKQTKGTPLSANYDFKGTKLDGIFSPYAIRKADGKKIGFIGLNVDPKGLVAADKIQGVVWKDIITSANETAAYLKDKEKCDLVVAVTHIGYEKENEKTTDVELACASKDIDIIIGGHSHTLIDPEHPEKFPSLVKNAEGRDVRIVQTGKWGKYLGYIKINLDNMEKQSGKDYEYRLIPVTDRFPKEKLDKNIRQFIKPYREVVDSVNSVAIAVSAIDMECGVHNGVFGNWAADFASYYGRQITDSINKANPGNLPLNLDFAIMNTGGIRQDMKKGNVSEGQILSTFPFSNHMVLVEISGADLLKAMQRAAKKNGEAISDEMRVVMNADKSIKNIVINGNAIDTSRTYLFATIDYLAWGNDDLDELANGKVVWRDNVEMSIPMLRYVRHLSELGMPINSDPNPRFIEAVQPH